MADLIESVGQLLRAAAATVVLPSFQHLAVDDVQEKAPGELVTVADRRAEVVIAEGLRALLPDSVVVGEEGVAADPGMLDRLRDAGPVWIVDPIDGTGNFAAGRGPFAIMVALLRDGATVAAWILDPLSGTLAVAEAGSGAYVDGVRVSCLGDGLVTAQLRGAAMSRFMAAPLRESVQRGTPALGEVHTGVHCAGREYVDLATGRQHFIIFWRTLPWDHAPGVLLVQEAGGVTRRLDGAPYVLTDDRRGLLVAANETIWDEVHAALLEPGG